MTSFDENHADAFERALAREDISSGTGSARAEREALELRLAPLSGLLDPVRPGADLFDRITAGLGLPLAGVHVVRGTEGHWRALCEGIKIKTLWHSEKSRRQAFLVSIQPGAILPEHAHSGDEECMVPEGDMVVNGVSFGPGDFQVAFADTRHPTITSRGGCVCLISVQLRAA